MGFRALQKYRMVAFNGSRFPWAGTDYTKMMVSSEITIPDSVSISTSLSYTSPNSPCSGTFTQSFILPEVYDVVKVFDGTAFGTVKIESGIIDVTSQNKLTLHNVTMNLEAINQDGNIRELIPTYYIQEDPLSCQGYDNRTINQSFMWWMQLDEMKININERIRYTISIPWTNYSALNQRKIYIRLMNARNGDDTMITFPGVVG